MNRLAALLFALPLVAPAASQPYTWERVPLTTTDVHAIQVLDDGDVYAATRGGLHRSLDGGNTWPRWFFSGEIIDLAIAPDEFLFVGGHGYGEADGTTYVAGGVNGWIIDGGSIILGEGCCTRDTDPHSRLRGLVAAPDGRGWAAIGNDVWDFIPWPRTWTRHELPVDEVMGLHRGEAGRLYAPTTDGLYASNDGALTWVSLGLEGRALTAAFEGPGNVLWAGDAAGNVYRSDDRGQTWRSAPVASTGILDLYVASGGAAFAGTAGEGLLRSDDGGRTWIAIDLDAPNGAPVVPALGGRPLGGTDEVWAAVEDDGLRRSTDGGVTWTAARWSDEGTVHVEAGPGGLVVAGDNGGYGLFGYARTTQTWRPLGFRHDPVQPNRELASVAAAPDGRLFAAVTELLEGARRTVLYRSTDGGASWKPVYTFPLRGGYGGEGTVRVLVAGRGSADGVLLAGTGPVRETVEDDPRAVVYRSTDGGRTWEEVAVFGGYEVEALAIGEGGIAYASGGFSDPVVYRGDDNGSRWTDLGPIVIEADTLTVMGLAVTRSGAVIAGLNAGYTIRSTDRGATWDVVLEEGHARTVTARGDQVLVGAGEVWESRDAGETWFFAGDLEGSVEDIAISDEGRAYVASRDGLFRTVEVVVAAEPGPEGPAAEGVSVYPNPLSGQGTVRFSLPRAEAQAVVEVFDALGRRVRRLHAGPLAAGAHALPITASGLPAGTYLVRVQTVERLLSRTFTVAH